MSIQEQMKPLYGEIALAIDTNEEIDENTML